MKGVQTLRPQAAVLIQPFVDLGERLRVQAVDPPLRFLTHVDEPGLTQDAEVTRYTRSGDRQQLSQFTDGGRMVPQHLQDRPSTFVRQRVQHGIHKTECNK